MSSDQPRIKFEDAAAQLGISVDELKTLRNSGRIRGYPDYGNWSFKPEDLDTLANELASESAAADVDPADPPTPSATAEPGPADERPANESRPSEPPGPDIIAIDFDDLNSNADWPKRTPDTFEALGIDDTADAIEAPQPVAIEPPPPAIPREEIIDSRDPISSRQLIEYLAGACQVPILQATAVVDAFWNFVIDPEHYEQGRRSLTLPHFGTFRLGRSRDLRTQLEFRSQPCQELRNHLESRGHRPPDESWIERWNQQAPHDLDSLSQKRRIAVGIAESTGMGLDVVFRLLWQFIETLTEIMSRGQAPIRWAKRGEMSPSEGLDDPAYRFRTYSRLTDVLPGLPEPRSDEALQITEFGSRVIRRGRRVSRDYQRGRATGSKTGCLIGALTLFSSFFLFVCIVSGFFS